MRKKSNACPEKNNETALEVYAVAFERKILSHNFDKRFYRNTTREKQEALERLKRYNGIVIKEADKGSAVVVLDRRYYVVCK